MYLLRYIRIVPVLLLSIYVLSIFSSSDDYQLQLTWKLSLQNSFQNSPVRRFRPRLILLLATCQLTSCDLHLNIWGKRVTTWILKNRKFMHSEFHGVDSSPKMELSCNGDRIISNCFSSFEVGIVLTPRPYK